MKEKKVSFKVERWPSHARDSEVDRLRCALATATAELEDVKHTLLEKELQLGERQQRVKELEAQNSALQEVVRWQKII